MKLAPLFAAALGAFLTLAPARAIDEAHQIRAHEISRKAIGWLRQQQDAKTGGWSVPKEGPAYPAITALVLNGMLMEPGLDAKDPTVAKGVAYVLSFRQPDGGIYDTVVPTYNTAICLSALSRVVTPEAKAAVKAAEAFLKSLQFTDHAGISGPAASETMKVGKDHPFYGGIGYGRGGRPDLSNTAFFVQAMHDAAVPEDDESFKAALVFLARTQMIEKAPDGTVINEMPYAKGSKQGGFIYSTSESKDQIGNGQSMAGTVEESLDNGERVSRLRAYGSMTYAGFKSLIYAHLPATDPRVQAAYGWIRRNYTLAENPGIGQNGIYYYFLTFGRALKAVGAASGDGKAAHRIVPLEGDKEGDAHDWANDLIDRLAQLQKEDGSFVSVDKRWLEDNPVLITAYALLALEHAR